MTKTLKSEHNDHQLWKWLGWASLAYFGCWLLMFFGGASVWDDSYMFSRYADNLLSGEGYAWNPGDSPAYGLTSQLHAAWVLVWRTFPGGSPALSLYLASFFLGLLFLYLMWGFLRYQGDRFGRLGGLMPALAGIFLAMNAGQFADHFSSGMDTMLALVWVTGYLWVFKHFERRLSPGRAMFLGALGGLAWSVRPDLMVFSTVPPLILALRSNSKVIRTQASYILVFTGFTVLLQLLLMDTLYNNILPLPFYVKSVGAYGFGFEGNYAGVAGWSLTLFLLRNILAVGLIAFVWISLRKKLMTFWSLADKSMLAAMLVFAAYFLFFVTPVMHYSSRFFFPMLPPLLYLAIRAFDLYKTERPEALVRLMSKGRGILAAVLIVLIGITAWTSRKPDNLSARIGRFDMETVYTQLGRHNWPMLDRFSFLPDDLVIASTEIGIPGAMNPRKQILDLAGLHDPGIARHGFSADSLFHKHIPDLIYLPHPDYEAMTRELEDNNFFRSHYQTYDSDTLGSYLGIALFRESRYYYPMKFIVEEELKKSKDKSVSTP